MSPRENDWHFTDDIFKIIFFNEALWILIKIPPKVVRKDTINNKPALVQVMTWRRTSDKPLSEPNDGSVYWRIYAPLGLNELRFKFPYFWSISLDHWWYTLAAINSLWHSGVIWGWTHVNHWFGWWPALQPTCHKAIIWTNTNCHLESREHMSLELKLKCTHFIQENELENFVCKMSSILFKSQCVGKTWKYLVRQWSRGHSRGYQIMFIKRHVPKLRRFQQQRPHVNVEGK